VPPQRFPRANGLLGWAGRRPGPGGGGREVFIALPHRATGASEAAEQELDCYYS
jgi:hypothetical protein